MLKLSAVDSTRAHDIVKECKSSAPLLLGFVHREVGALYDIERIRRSIFEADDANGGADLNAFLLNDEDFGH